MREKPERDIKYSAYPASPTHKNAFIKDFKRSDFGATKNHHVNFLY